MRSGLRAAFASSCREGCVRLFLLYLFSVSGGMLSIRCERKKIYKNNNNAAERGGKDRLLLYSAGQETTTDLKK